MIKPGHYQTKSSLNSESKDIIRIIGPKPGKKGFWITDDGKTIADYVLEEDYVNMNTVKNLDYVKSQEAKINIFADFEPVEIDEVIDNQNESDETEQLFEQRNYQNNVVQINVKESVQKKYEDPKVLETKNILHKIDIDFLNQKNFDKYGERPYKKEKIKFEVPLILNYNISKLETTIELLDLDVELVLDCIVKESFQNIESLLRDELRNLLILKHIPEDKKYGMLEVNENLSHLQNIGPGPTKIQVYKNPEEVVIKSNETLEQKITEVSNYINNLLNNKTE